MIFHELINNITLLLTVILFFSLVIEKCPVESRRQYVFYGLIFGIASIVGMENSFKFSDGIVYDARSVILSIAGLLGGPVAAAISALIAGVYRFVMGGAGVLAGVGTILTSSLLGVLFYYLSQRYKKLLTPLFLYFFGVLVNGAVLLWMFTLPHELIGKVVETVGAPLMILFPLATVLVGAILLHQKRGILAQKEAEKQLRNLNENLQKMVRKEVEKNREKDQLLIHQSKLATLGEMLGAIAHHWRQPLTAVSLNIQNIYDLYEHGELTEAEMEQSVGSAMALIQKMSHTIDEFRRFFEPGTAKEFFSLNTALSDIRSLIGPELDEKHIELDIEALKEDIRLHGYQNRLKQTLLNLISNAKDAIVSLRNKGEMPREVAGLIRMRAYRDGGDVIIEVTDNGGGIEPDMMEHIFTPYFSTKEQGEGVGIGLYMSRVIIEKYFKGSIALENSAGGLKATVRLNPEPGAA